jgi:protoporphyrinogen oxidase
VVAVTSRRALLQATASGWIIAQLGEGPRRLEGKTLGASHELGHLLRDPSAAKNLPEGARERCDVLVAGAGVSGLSAAWRLAPAGLDVHVVELEPFLGGTSAYGEEGVVPHPWGAHYLPAPNPEARATLRLLESMGVVTGFDAAGLPRFDGRVLCHAPEERIFYQGKWQPGLVPLAALSEAEREEMHRFGEIVERFTEARGKDGRFAFQIPLSESSRDPELLALDRITMARWLDEQGFTTDFLRWYVRYATLDDFGGEPEDVSAWAGLHYFAARKLKTPELEGSHFLVWPEGNGRLVRELRDRSNAKTTPNLLVVSVEESAQGVVVQCVDRDRTERRVFEARAAVLAVPAFVARRLVAGAALPERASSPWLVANLHVERAFDPDNHAWDSVLYDSHGLGYVDASHQLTPPQDRTVLTYFRAFGAANVQSTRTRLLDMPFEALANSVLRDLAPAHPDLSRRLSRMDVVVWGHAMPRPRPGFLGERPFEVEQLLGRRTAWAHTDVTGIALFEEAQRAGVRAAELLAPAIGVDLGASWA